MLLINHQSLSLSRKAEKTKVVEHHHHNLKTINKSNLKNQLTRFLIGKRKKKEKNRRWRWRWRHEIMDLSRMSNAWTVTRRCCLGIVDLHLPTQLIFFFWDFFHRMHPQISMHDSIFLSRLSFDLNAGKFDTGARCHQPKKHCNCNKNYFQCHIYVGCVVRNLSIFLGWRRKLQVHDIASFITPLLFIVIRSIQGIKINHFLYLSCNWSSWSWATGQTGEIQKLWKYISTF